MLEKLRALMPHLKGTLTENASLKPFTWFRTGGNADILFTVEDEADLSYFLKNLPLDIPVYPIGLGSNLIVRDGGIAGVVIRLGKSFIDIEFLGDYNMEVGAACPDMRLALSCAREGIGGLSFYRGIPGTIGGALRMNAGAYGGETKDILVSARGINRQGELKIFSNADMNYSYRHCGLPEDIIFTYATFQGYKADTAVLQAEMEKVTSSRTATQPVNSKTGGSTFKNPEGHSSWKLIDDAGLRGFKVGDAQVSDLHCNFLINNGNATASDIETLGETIREKVKAKSGVELQWEIKRVGRK